MKILAADGVSPKGIEILRNEGYEVVVKDKLPADELLAIIGEYDALIVRSASKVTKEVLEAVKNLKIIGRAGVGVDNIDVAEATARGIVVINSPGGNTIAATEHTMGMMLAMARHMSALSFAGKLLVSSALAVSAQVSRNALRHLRWMSSDMIRMSPRTVQRQWA